MNEPEIKNTSEITEQKGLSLKYFRELVENNPSAEKIKQELGDFGEEYEAPIPETLQKEDKEKLKAYAEKEVEDLPKDWRAEIARLKELERKLFDYEEKKEELKGWTDTFSEQKPEEIKSQIQQLEEKQVKTEEELTAQIKDLEEKLTAAQQEKETILTTSQQKEQELTEKLKQWSQSFEDKELEEVKSEWANLQQRPDITISEEQFYNDYARRLTLSASKLEKEELIKQKALVEEYKEKNTKLWFEIGKYLKAIRRKKYASIKPVLTISQAREAIAELLETTEKEWLDYLEGSEIIPKTPELGLSFWKKDTIVKAYQILKWIEEARKTLDYQTLFERWNGGADYTKESEENDFDGSLFLLGKYLEVEDFEIPQLNS